MKDEDYKKLYFFLFNRISDIIGTLENTSNQLKQIQCTAEEMYIEMKITDAEEPTDE